MTTALVPVTMGSARFVRRELASIDINVLWFPPTLHLPPHTHDRPVFGVMLDGYMRGRLGRRRYECARDTVFTEPAGELHDNHFARAGGRVLAILPDTTAAESFDAFSKLLDKPAHFRDAQIIALASRVKHEIMMPDALSVLAVEAFTFEMLIAAARRENRRSERMAPPPWLERARELLHDRAFDKLRLSEIAAQSGVHARQLTRMFRVCYGTSIGEYVRRLRLEWAAAQLRAGKTSLSEIAITAGFADQSHFTRAFRKQFGCTPGEFRSASARK